MLSKIYPTYILTTYIIDPLNQKKCYIFIENTISKEIKHYTVIIDNEFSHDEVRKNILNVNFEIIKNFDILFHDITKIYEDVNFCKNMTNFYFRNKVLIILKQLIDMCSLFMCKVDKYELFTVHKTLSDNDFYKNSSKYICNYLQEFLILGDKLNSKNNFNKYSSNNYEKIKNYENYLTNKILRSYTYKFRNLKLQTKQINSFARSSYFYCLRHDITAKCVIYYVLEKINMLNNKLSKFTFLMSFSRILSDENRLQNRVKILKIIIFINAYQKHTYMELNDLNSISIIYSINGSLEFNNKISLIYRKIIFCDDTGNIGFKKVIIIRFIFLVLMHKNTFLQKIDNLLNYQEILDIIWLIVKCCVIAIYKMFKISF